MKQQRRQCDEIRKTHEMLHVNVMEIPSQDGVRHPQVSIVVPIVQDQVVRLAKNKGRNPHRDTAQNNQNQQFPFARRRIFLQLQYFAPGFNIGDNPWRVGLGSAM